MVASNSRGLRFESSHWQKLYLTLLTVNFIEKTEIKKKRPGIAIEKETDKGPLKTIIYCIERMAVQYKRVWRGDTGASSECRRSACRTSCRWGPGRRQTSSRCRDAEAPDSIGRSRPNAGEDVSEGVESAEVEVGGVDLCRKF